MNEQASFAFRNDDPTILTLDSIGWQTIQNPITDLTSSHTGQQS